MSITTRQRYGLNKPLRYFTERFLLYGEALEGNWRVSLGTAKPPESYAGGVVKHTETGHIWVISDEPPELWADQRIFLGRWPD